MQEIDYNRDLIEKNKIKMGQFAIGEIKIKDLGVKVVVVEEMNAHFWV